MTKFYENAALVVGIILYLGTLFSLSLLTETSIFLVFVGTLPILLYLIAFFYLAKIDPGMALLWVLPLIFPLIFLLIYYSKSFMLLSQMDYPSIAIVDIVISYVINIFLLIIIGIGRVEKPKVVHHAPNLKNELEDVKQHLHNTKAQLEEAHAKLDRAKLEMQKTRELVIDKDNFNVSLRGIEDKCKAINFVIGRVYSDKRGASQEVRDKLKIYPEWYNAFSEITADFKEEEKSKLKHVLNSIEVKLLQLEQKENGVVNINIGKLPIYRKLGDRVIDVLARNDKDPVVEYHAEAKEVCRLLFESNGEILTSL